MLPLAEPYRLRVALKMARLLRPRAGLRESGVAPAEFPLVAIRSTALKMDAVVAAAGRRGPGRSSLIGTPAMRTLVLYGTSLGRAVRGPAGTHLPCKTSH